MPQAWKLSPWYLHLGCPPPDNSSCGPQFHERDLTGVALSTVSASSLYNPSLSRFLCLLCLILFFWLSDLKKTSFAQCFPSNAISSSICTKSSLALPSPSSTSYFCHTSRISQQTEWHHLYANQNAAPFSPMQPVTNPTFSSPKPLSNFLFIPAAFLPTRLRSHIGPNLQSPPF